MLNTSRFRFYVKPRCAQNEICEYINWKNKQKESLPKHYAKFLKRHLMNYDANTQRRYNKKGRKLYVLHKYNIIMYDKSFAH